MTEQTQTERDSLMVRELKRVKRELAAAKRTGKKRSISWIMIDLNTGEVSPPPTALRVVK
jgi:hypothetical protein